MLLTVFQICGILVTSFTLIATLWLIYILMKERSEHHNRIRSGKVYLKEIIKDGNETYNTIKFIAYSNKEKKWKTSVDYVSETKYNSVNIGDEYTEGEE
jgi:hypothetical protein